MTHFPGCVGKLRLHIICILKCVDKFCPHVTVPRDRYVSDSTCKSILQMNVGSPTETRLSWFCEVNQVTLQVDRKKPRPPGRFPIYYVPKSKTWKKRIPLAEPGASTGVLFLPLSTWLGNLNIVNSKPPRGMGLLSIKVIIKCQNYQSQWWRAEFDDTLYVWRNFSYIKI